MDLLGAAFYARDAKTVANELLGKLLIREVDGGRRILRITETEAYLGAEDPACHGYQNRRTPRTEVMFGRGGHCYIYLIYGMHYLLNAVTGEEGDPSAVLIRAGEPVEGVDAMAQSRFGLPWGELSKGRRKSLCDGPGKLAKALEITQEQNGLPLTGSQLYICREKEGRPFQIKAGPRIGIGYAGEAVNWPLNFVCQYE